MERLQDRVAVVTGGADGIGLGMARAFLHEGMKVMLADIDGPRLDAAARELAALGEVAAHRTDVADSGAVALLAARTLARFGAVHVLCNNAGVGGYQSFVSTDLESWRWQLGVNLWGAIHGCHAFLPILMRQEEAHIVNTASMAAFFSGPYSAPYNVSKAGVVALTEGLARELVVDAPHVGISALCPGPVVTRIAEDERNAPPGHVARGAADPALAAMRTRLATGLAAGLPSDAVGALCVEALRDRRLFVFTHPEWTHVAADRGVHIADGRPGPYPIRL